MRIPRPAAWGWTVPVLGVFLWLGSAPVLGQADALVLATTPRAAFNAAQAALARLEARRSPRG